MFGHKTMANFEVYTFPAVASFALAAGLSFAAPSPPAEASDADRAFNECQCATVNGGGACEHFLRNPAGVVDDPCWCDKCRNGATGQKHDGKTIPPTGKAFKIRMATFGHWTPDGVMDKEYMFWDDQELMKQIGLAK